MDNYTRQLAIKLIPELESTFNIDMSLESFVKNDIPNYFNIEEEDNGAWKDVTFNFETTYGSASITIKYFGTRSEELHWNDIMQLHIDNESSLFPN